MNASAFIDGSAVVDAEAPRARRVIRARGAHERARDARARVSGRRDVWRESRARKGRLNARARCESAEMATMGARVGARVGAFGGARASMTRARDRGTRSRSGWCGVGRSRVVGGSVGARATREGRRDGGRGMTRGRTRRRARARDARAREDADDDDVTLTPIDPEIPEGEDWGFEFPRSPADVTNLWRGAPSRYRILFVTVFAFIVCNMDKVNISVAIIPMARDFGWTSTQAGFIQSAFFYGFAASQLPGGFLSTKLGGAKVLPIGMLILSLATLCIPVLGTDEKSIFLARVLVGLGEGVAPSAATDIIARSVTVNERSRAVGFVFSGFNIGSVLGLGVAPVLIDLSNWRVVFAVFGVSGLLWSAWAFKMYGSGGMIEESDNNDPVTGLTGKRVFTVDRKAIERGEKPMPDPPVPWGEFISNPSVRALMYVHYCQNWGFYVLLAWLPSYFTDELGVTLTNASLLTLLPPLANVAMASVAAPTADRLISSGMEVTRVRKTMQAIAFLGPATAMTTAAVVDQPIATVGLLTFGISLGAFSYAGLYSNHQDLSPKYASILLGMTNTCGALPGVIGVPLTGYLIKETGNWELSMFLPAIFFYLTGTAIFAKYGSGERQPFTGQPMPFPGELESPSDGGGH